MAECGKYIGHGVVSFPCGVEMGHEGPCMAQELPRSIEDRRKWSHHQSGLGQFQGAPQTVAEGLHADPEALTAVPGLHTRQTAEETRRLDHLSATTPTGYVHCTGCGLTIEGEHVSQHVTDEHKDSRPMLVVGQGPGLKGTVKVTAGPQGIKAVKATLDRPKAKVKAKPTKTRPGDQPLPEVNGLPFVQDAVIEDIQARKAVGIQRYGTPLQAFNGRDVTLDAYEEALDLAMYLRQQRIEREEIGKKVAALNAIFTTSPGADFVSNLADAAKIAADLAEYFDV